MEASRCVRSAAAEQPVLFHPHCVRNVIDAPDGIARAGLPQHRDAAGYVVAFDEIDGLGEFVEPCLDWLAQFFAVLELNWIIAGEPGQLVDVGEDARGCGIVLGKKTRLRGQQKSARRAFGGADLQQQG